MPARKTTAHKTTHKERVQTARSVDEISYETKLTIVILLLLFVYPLGLIFMWAWMRNWPLWLKVLISLPVILGIMGIFFGIFFVSLLIRHAVTDKAFQNMMRDRYQKQYLQQYQITPSAMPSLTPEASPTPSDTTY
jgi:hypothetical protein